MAKEERDFPKSIPPDTLVTIPLSVNPRMFNINEIFMAKVVTIHLPGV